MFCVDEKFVWLDAPLVQPEPASNNLPEKKNCVFVCSVFAGSIQSQGVSSVGRWGHSESEESACRTGSGRRNSSLREEKYGYFQEDLVVVVAP